MIQIYITNISKTRKIFRNNNSNKKIFAYYSILFFFSTFGVMKYGSASAEESDEKNYFRKGDMLFGKSISNERAGIEGVIGYGEKYNVAWTDNRIPYEFDESVKNNPEHLNRIQQAMKDLMDAVPNCFAFEPKTDKDPHWVNIRDNGNGCSSAVGNQSWTGRTPQPCTMTVRCRFGAMVHEFIHTLGFFHEHTRDDRDDYVQVLFANIADGHTHNFKKDGQTYQDITGISTTGYNTSYYGTKYNFDSIMHYPLTAFTKNYLPTMIKKDVFFAHLKNNTNSYGWNFNPGQREKLSEGDLRMIATKYGCKMPPHKEFKLTFSEDYPDDVYDNEYEIYTPSITTTTTASTTTAKTDTDRPRKPCKLTH